MGSALYPWMPWRSASGQEGSRRELGQASCGWSSCKGRAEGGVPAQAVAQGASGTAGGLLPQSLCPVSWLHCPSDLCRPTVHRATLLGCSPVSSLRLGRGWAACHLGPGPMSRWVWGRLGALAGGRDTQGSRQHSQISGQGFSGDWGPKGQKLPCQCRRDAPGHTGPAQQ